MRHLLVVTAFLAFFLCSGIVEGQISVQFEPVALVQSSSSNLDVRGNVERRKPVIKTTPREVRESFMKMHEHDNGPEGGRRLEEEMMATTVNPMDYDSEEGRSYEDDYDGNDQAGDELEETEDLSTEIVASTSHPNVTGTNRTKLYPIGRLWERTPVDLWSVVNAAFSCLWSGLGLECFSFKVVPMVKSLMGYQPFFLPSPLENPYYILPRRSERDETDNQDTDKTEPIAETDEDAPRKRKHHALKLAKWALYGFAAAKTVLVPLLSAMSFVSGKALVFSLLAGALTVAIAWNSVLGRNADRRIYDNQNQSNYYPYSTLYV